MKNLLVFGVLSVLIFTPLLIFASNGDNETGGFDIETGGVTLPDPLDGKDFITILEQIVNFLILAAIPIAALMIIYGAYQIMFAGGDTEKVTTGKRTILYTVVAFVIILLALGIIEIIKDVLGVTVVE